MFKSHPVDHHPDDGTHGGGLRTALVAVALASLLTQTWRTCRETHRRRHASRPEPKPEPLQTWEGEGGQRADRTVDPVRRRGVDGPRPLSAPRRSATARDPPGRSSGR
jgi:hypothetical protein